MSANSLILLWVIILSLGVVPLWQLAHVPEIF